MAPPGAVAVAAEVQARLLRVLEDDGEAEGLVEDAVGAVALLLTDCGDGVVGEQRLPRRPRAAA